MQWQPEKDVGMCDPEARQLREEGAWQTPKSVGKIINKIDNLEPKMRKMSISDEKSKEPPYKPQVAPPRCRGGNRFRGTVRNPKAALTYSNRGNNGFKRNNGRPQSNFQSRSSRGIYRGRFQRNGFRGRGRFDKSSNVSRPWVTSKTFKKMPQDAIIAKNQATYCDSVTDTRKMNIG